MADTQTPLPQADFSQAMMDKLLSPHNEADAEVNKIEAQRKASTEQFAEKYSKLSGAQVKAERGGVAPPPPPNFKAFDNVKPPSDQYTDPSKGLSSTLGIFAVLASFAARRPAVGAMRALAGIIKGNVQGQKEQYDLNYKKFLANMQLAQNEMQKETAEYNAMWKRADWNEQQRQASLRAYATAKQDSMMLYQLNNQQYDQAENLIRQREQVVEQIQGKVLQFQWEMAKNSAGRYTATMQKQDMDTIAARATWAQVPEEDKKKLEEMSKQQPGTMMPDYFQRLAKLEVAAKKTLYSDQMTGGGAQPEQPKQEGQVPSPTQVIQFRDSGQHPREFVLQEYKAKGGDEATFNAIWPEDYVAPGSKTEATSAKRGETYQPNPLENMPF